MRKKVKAIELVLDWNLWPRQDAGDLDGTNMRRIKEAMRSGVTLPPVIVNQKDYRVIDGFHRTKAALKLYGDDAKIKADLRNFKNEQEMFLLSMQANSNHGLPLSPVDRAHAFHKARKMKAPIPAIAAVLGMEVESLKKFVKKRTAKTRSGENIALTGGAQNLAGETLTQSQEEFVRKAPGTNANMYASLLLAGLKNDAVILTEKTLGTLAELREYIDKILDDVATESK